MGAGEVGKQELIFTQCGARGKELKLLANAGMWRAVVKSGGSRLTCGLKKAERLS